MPKGTTPHSIENYWPFTFLSSTFATSWKATLSLFTQTMFHSLTHAISSPLKDAPGRRLRQLQFILEFTTDIQYVKGTDNVVADLLSRPSKVNALFKGFQGIYWNFWPGSNFRTRKCLSFAALAQHRFASKNTPYQTPTLLCYLTPLCPFPVIVPYNLRKLVFDAVHSLFHPGIRASRQLISKRFVWEGMQKGIAEFVSLVNSPRSTVTILPHCNRFYNQTRDFQQYTVTWWVPFPKAVAMLTYSPL